MLCKLVVDNDAEMEGTLTKAASRAAILSAGMMRNTKNTESTAAPLAVLVCRSCQFCPTMCPRR